MACIVLKNCTESDGHNGNGIVTGQIKQPHFLSQASSFYPLSLDGEPTQKIVGWTKNDEKMDMAAFFDRKLIISASILLRKSCLGSKLGDLRSGNPFMYV